MPNRLQGRGILVVEDEPLIAMDIAEALEGAGAEVTTTATLALALLAVERDGIAGAVVDHSLKDGNSAPLCERLKERRIPFLMYSGIDSRGEGPCSGGRHLGKPATEEQLVVAMAEIIGSADR